MDSGDMLAAADRTSLPKDDCCLMGYRTLEDLKNVSEVQVDEENHPSQRGLGHSGPGVQVENTRGSRELVRGTGRRQIIPAITDLNIPLGMGS